VFFRGPNLDYSGPLYFFWRTSPLTVESIGYLVICAVAGLAIICYGLYQRARQRASDHWQQTVGTIRSAKLLDTNATDSAEYRVAVTYEYEVNGARYAGKRIEFGTRGYARKKRAQEQFARYAVNSNVVVFFDPAEPAEAVLVRETPNFALHMTLGIAMLVLVVGIVVYRQIR
jgi:hypothetical protein